MLSDNQLVIFFLAVFFSISCQTNTVNKQSGEEELVIDTLSFEEIEKDLQEEQQAEVYKIDKKAVIFFSIPLKEIRKLTRELGDSYRWETDMLFNGFKEQTREFKNVLSRQGIYSKLVYNRRFKVILEDSSVFTFDREKDEQIMGQILNNGVKEPLLSYGMYKNNELAALVREFFEIENLGYVPVDTMEVKPREAPIADSTATTTTTPETTSETGTKEEPPIE